MLTIQDFSRPRTSFLDKLQGMRQARQEAFERVQYLWWTWQVSGIPWPVGFLNLGPVLWPWFGDQTFLLYLSSFADMWQGKFSTCQWLERWCRKCSDVTRTATCKEEAVKSYPVHGGLTAHSTPQDVILNALPLVLLNPCTCVPAVCRCSSLQSFCCFTVNLFNCGEEDNNSIVQLCQLLTPFGLQVFAGDYPE